MRRIRLILLLALLICVPAQADFTGKVIGVSDGDTLTVLTDQLLQVKVRLSGIDAPEKAQPFGRLAKENLSDLVYGKPVLIQDRKIDRYGRTIGLVLVSMPSCKGECPKVLDISLEQIKQGLGWHYKAYQREQPASERSAYAQAEIDAQTARKGLWRDPEAVAPWEWRSSKRSQSSKGKPGEAQSNQPLPTAGNPCRAIKDANGYRIEC